MCKEDIDLVLDFMKSRQTDFERFLKDERGLSPHAATFIIEDLEYAMKKTGRSEGSTDMGGREHGQEEKDPATA